jgi:high-affinity iron transporter
VVLALTAEFVYARAVNAPVQATALVAQNGQLRIPLSQLMDSSLHYYTTEVSQADIRFLVIHKAGGDYATVLDACQICGPVGYRQDGQNVICRNCGAAIYIPSIGQSGGCNPIAVKSRVENGEVVVDLSALLDAVSTIHAK